MRRAALVLSLIGLALGAGLARAELPRYEIDAVIEPDEGEIHGSVRIRFLSQGDRVLLHLYPNRFRADGNEVDDTTRKSVYPRGVFDPGSITVSHVFLLPSERALPFRTTDPAGLARQTLLEVDLPEGSDGAIAIEVVFHTHVPVRFGPFGVTEQGLAAVGGWHPYLAARDQAGRWQVDWAPPAAQVLATVSAPPARTVVLGSSLFRAGHSGRLRVTEDLVRNVALLAPQDPELVEVASPSTSLLFVEPHEPRTSRLGPDPGPDRRFRELVIRILEESPATLAAPSQLTVAQIPLRWNLTTQSDAPVVVSDRAMHVQAILEGFHAAQIAQTVYARLLKNRVLACEPAGQRDWIQQGVAWYLADRFLRKTQPDHRSVHQWIRWLDFIAIVDRFESAPKIPFANAFFENSITDDELRESIFSYARQTPPARLSLARLDREIGAADLEAAIEHYVERLDGPCITLAQSLREATGQPPSRVREEISRAREPVIVAVPRARVDPKLAPRGERSTLQFVLDNADIDVSSSEFGVGFLFLLRKRYDYSKDIAFLPYFNERSYGIRVGPRFHFGKQNNPNNYRQNLVFYYQISGLDTGFRDDSRPGVENSGGVAGFGLRYDYSNVYWYNDPTEKRSFRLFVDGYDPSLGGDYSFLRYGVRLRGTTKLGSANTIGAIEILTAFEDSFSSRGIPIQEQYSLGGQRSIRGISVNRELATNLGLARFEIRQAVYPEFDLNLFDFLSYRRPQIRLFLDTGNVDDSAGRALNPARWAIGAGIGVNVLYDFMGFFPGSAYLEIATRLDQDQGDVQVLFGSRQAF